MNAWIHGQAFAGSKTRRAVSLYTVEYCRQKGRSKLTSTDIDILPASGAAVRRVPLAGPHKIRTAHPNKGHDHAIPTFLARLHELVVAACLTGREWELCLQRGRHCGSTTTLERWTNGKKRHRNLMKRKCHPQIVASCFPLASCGRCGIRSSGVTDSFDRCIPQKLSTYKAHDPGVTCLSRSIDDPVLVTAFLT